MKFKASYKKYILHFIQPAGTSRGVYREKVSYFLFLGGKDTPYRGVGECNILSGLSIDDVPGYEAKLNELCRAINEGSEPRSFDLSFFPSISFALETALKDFEVKGSKILFPSPFTSGGKGIVTNGLIWMGDEKQMQQRIDEKLAAGFHTLKLKIGAINTEKEIELLRAIRKYYDHTTITLRVDANGAFTEDNIFPLMDELASLQVHSIEQPVAANNHRLMQKVIRTCSVPVALDEELIGVVGNTEQKALIHELHPAYLILKPALLGGIGACEKWIQLAEEYNIGWWATSALESNIGLNAIAQWIAIKDNQLPQGLGLGNLYRNNIDSPLELRGEKMFYNNNKHWNTREIETNA